MARAYDWDSILFVQLRVRGKSRIRQIMEEGKRKRTTMSRWHRHNLGDYEVQEVVDMRGIRIAM